MLTAHNENERRNGRQRAYGSGEAAAIDLLREEILPDLHVIDVTIYLRGRASLWTALKGAILFLAIKRPRAEGIVCGDLTVSSSPRVEQLPSVGCGSCSWVCTLTRWSQCAVRGSAARYVCTVLLIVLICGALDTDSCRKTRNARVFRHFL